MFDLLGRCHRSTAPATGRRRRAIVSARYRCRRSCRRRCPVRKQLLLKRCVTGRMNRRRLAIFRRAVPMSAVSTTGRRRGGYPACSARARRQSTPRWKRWIFSGPGRDHAGAQPPFSVGMIACGVGIDDAGQRAAPQDRSAAAP